LADPHHIQSNYSQINIRDFRAVLDSILGTAILTLGCGASSMPKALLIVDRANLRIQATTTEPTFAIRLQSETQRALCMDGEAVEAVPDACEYILPEFKDMSFEAIIAAAFRVARSDRAMEPLLMLMPVTDQLSALSVRELFFFAPKVFEARGGLLGTLAEVCKRG
jgi:phospholipid N-methyltransferase